MKIHWQKKGLIYVPNGDGVLKTHATRPIPYKLNEEILRIFFSSRDAEDRMLPTFIDVDINNPTNILSINSLPLIKLGRNGTFDDMGMVPNCFVQDNDANIALCYYCGWKKRAITVNFELAIGLATINLNNNEIKRMYEGPIISQDKNHPFLVAGAFVLRDDGKYKMWYCSGTEWCTAETGIEPLYNVNYAESCDGINWDLVKKSCIEYKFVGEVITCPWVVKIQNEYHMWYSTRGSATKKEKNYKIGYATSSDGINWMRKDNEVGIERSSEGWDSEMQCYPSFFSHGDLTYMFYSGNDVGRGGIGYAVAPRFF